MVYLDRVVSIGGRNQVVLFVLACVVVPIIINTVILYWIMVGTQKFFSTTRPVNGKQGGA